MENQKCERCSIKATHLTPCKKPWEPSRDILLCDECIDLPFRINNCQWCNKATTNPLKEVLFGDFLTRRVALCDKCSEDNDEVSGISRKLTEKCKKCGTSEGDLNYSSILWEPEKPLPFCDKCLKVHLKKMDNIPFCTCMFCDKLVYGKNGRLGKNPTCSPECRKKLIVDCSKFNICSWCDRETQNIKQDVVWEDHGIRKMAFCDKCKEKYPEVTEICKILSCTKKSYS